MLFTVEYVKQLHSVASWWCFKGRGGTETPSLAPRHRHTVTRMVSRHMKYEWGTTVFVTRSCSTHFSHSLSVLLLPRVYYCLFHCVSQRFSLSISSQPVFLDFYCTSPCLSLSFALSLSLSLSDMGCGSHTFSSLEFWCMHNISCIGLCLYFHVAA